MMTTWMRATGCLAGVGLLLAVMSSGAEAQQQQDIDSANSVLPHCKVLLRARPVGTFGEGVCAGSIAALASVGGILDDRAKFCVPKGVTNGQMARVVVAYIEARLARMHEDFRLLALEALRAAWPCQANGVFGAFGPK